MVGKIRLDWESVYQLHSSSKIDNLLAKFENIFKDELGTVKEVKAHIQLNPICEPSSIKHTQSSMALRQKVEEELDCLERTKIIQPARHSQWATPEVPVIKSD